MNNLREVLTVIPPQRICLVSNEISISYGDIETIIHNNRDVIENLKLSNIVINGRGRLEFSKLLFLLDGEVNSILFLPKDIDSSLHDKYYKESNANYEVFLENNVLKYNIIKEVKKQNSFQETTWIIPTSGTTNMPKLVVHTFQSLTRTVKGDIEKGKYYRWGLVFDIYRFSGLQVFLQAMISGSTLIVSESDMSMTETLNNLIKNNCHALSATPTFWRKVMMSKEANSLDFKVITLGGEIADENILQALKTKFSDAKILHIYASTEAGVGFSVNDAHAGFPYKYIENDINGIILKLSDTNTLMIKNKQQIQKYLTTNDLYKEDGFIDTGDIVEIKNERVYFLGRDSGAINVGGNKVQPEEVENILISFSLIHAAFVYAKKNPMMGSIVCADIVLSDNIIDKKIAKSEILKFCREKLENFKIPAIVKFVNELETTYSGKLKRN
jgi:acyl-CoA synthetase (AMP-forming)/AMP-acid ligase II